MVSTVFCEWTLIFSRIVIFLFIMVDEYDILYM